MRSMYATVVVSSRQSGIGNGLTYRVGLGQGLGLGQLVKVPLRKRLIEGIVVDISDEKPEGDYDLREIAEVLGDSPLLSEAQIKVARFIAEYYVCSLRQALSPFLPGMLWGKLLPEKECFVTLASLAPPASALGAAAGKQHDTQKKFGKKQQELLDFLQGKEWVKWNNVQRETGVGKAILKKLVEKGVVEIEERASAPAFAVGAIRGSTQLTTGSPPLLPSDVTLTPRQIAAYKAIKADPRPTLLFGITGSGKTEIYAALIRDAISEGKSAILLLPEILLTENFIERFQKLVSSDAIAIVHSRLTPAKRRNEWRRIRAGEIRLVIGSRSALFSPLQNLGLIIVDEEHEWTYKNEQSPRYHATKVAEHLCHPERSASIRLGCAARSRRIEDTLKDASTSGAASLPDATPSAQHDIKLVLGTATPSVESWFKAKNGAYQLVELPERFGGALLPSVQIVDLGTLQFGRFYPLSPPPCIPVANILIF